jgi:predicted RNA-binding Zn ribbon-like protein
VYGGVVPRYDLPKAAPPPLRVVQQFVNTIDCEHRREWLDTPTALAAWLCNHGLEIDEPVSQADLRRATDVRETLRALARRNSGHPLPIEAVLTFNREIRTTRIVFELDEFGRLLLSTSGRGLDGALGHLLRSVIEGMQDGTWVRLKSCGHCRWLFYDYSKNRSARWCSMELCGNRAKTRAYRARRRPAPSG